MPCALTSLLSSAFASDQTDLHILRKLVQKVQKHYTVGDIKVDDPITIRELRRSVPPDQGPATSGHHQSDRRC